MAKRGQREKPKTDGSAIPRAPDSLSSIEKKHYEHFAGLVRRAAFAVGIDVEAIALAAQRKAKLETLRRMFAALPESSYWLTSDGGSCKAHPLFAELRHAEKAMDDSLRNLFLSPKSRAQNRTGGAREVDPATEAKTAAQAKILKYLA